MAVGRKRPTEEALEEILEAYVEPVTRGRYFPHIVGNWKHGKGVKLPLVNHTEEFLIASLDSIPHEEWPRHGCRCATCRKALRAAEQAS